MGRRFTPWTLAIIGVMAYFTIRGGALENPLEWFMFKLYLLPGIVIGLAFHEFAHAFVADKLGDDTPRLQGRVTINPIAHVDPLGMIALFFVGFGWGKPVQINPRNFKKRRRDELLVSLAGVTTNLILAIIFTFVLKIIVSTMNIQGDGFGSVLYEVVFYIVYINLVLMIFNLLPIPPLDGFNVLTEIFNLKKYDWWYKVYDKGFIILIILIILNFTGRILTPTINFFLDLLSNIIYL